MDLDYGTTALETLLVVDILQFAGLSFILTGLLKKKLDRPLWILCIALLMQAAGIWGGSYDIHPDLLHMFTGLIVYTGPLSSFPLMLCFVYPAAGMVFGEMLKKTDDKNLLYKKVLAVSAAVLASTVAVMLLMGYDLRNFYALSYDVYYQQDICHFLFTLSIVMIAFAFCQLFVSGLERTRPGRLITYCSVNLNTIYVIQWLLVTYSFAALILIGIEWIGIAAVIPTGLVMTAAATGISAIWKRVRNG